MTENQPPFILKQGEIMISDAPSVQYFGVGISSIGFFGGGTAGLLFGGAHTSMQRKREKSFWDAEFCHVYLTNLRIVFVKAKFSMFSTNKEKKLENVISDIPLEMIEGILPGSKVLNPTVELAVKSPTGEINNIVFAFLGTKQTLSFKHHRIPERDEWIIKIRKCREHLPRNVLSVATDEDPLKILKLRYAKGEITKDEYEQIKSDLGG